MESDPVSFHPSLSGKNEFFRLGLACISTSASVHVDKGFIRSDRPMRWESTAAGVLSYVGKAP